jgi:hypothetical protein
MTTGYAANFRTAAKWTAFLQANDDEKERIVIRKAGCDGLRSRSVMDAAEQNTSITGVRVNAADMSEGDAFAASSLLSRLQGLSYVCLESNKRVPPSVIGAVLSGLVVRSPGSLRRRLCFLNDASPGHYAFVELAKRCPSVETLSFGHWGDEEDLEWGDEENLETIKLSDELADAVSFAVSRYMTSLRHFFLSCDDGSLPFASKIVASLGTSRIREFGLRVAPRTQALLRNACFLCVVTESIQEVAIRNTDYELCEIIDIRPFLCPDNAEQSFSPAIRHVVLEGFRFEPSGQEDERLAGLALRHVERLDLLGCCLDDVGALILGMQHLETLIICHPSRWNLLPRVLDSNDDLINLCQALASPYSMVRDLTVELDCEHRNSGDFTYPAVDSLLRTCRGRLSLRCTYLPWESAEHIIQGLAHLRGDLTSLDLSFACNFGDGDYRQMLRALHSNRSLTELELNFVIGEDETNGRAIGDFLLQIPRLQMLSLPYSRQTGNQMMLESAIDALAAENRSLVRLDVKASCTRIPLDALSAPLPRLLNMLQFNDVFHTLNGVQFPKDDPMSAQVQHLLKLNRYGRRFLVRRELWPQCKSPAIWAQILANIARDGKHAVMFHFLRNKPSPPPVVSVAMRGVKRSRQPSVGATGPRRSSSSRRSSANS